MTEFTANVLAELTAGLTEGLINAAGHRVRETLQGSEVHQALERCTEAGLVALLRRATADAPEDTDLLHSIFTAFFADPEVKRELAQLLRGRRLDVGELRYLFEQAGYDPATLPGLDFEAGMAVFAGAFVEAAVAEEALHGLIQAGNVQELTRLSRAQLAELRTLVRWVRAAPPRSVGIEAGEIHAKSVVNGIQVNVYQGSGPHHDVPPSLQQAYLNYVAETAGKLALSGVDPKLASEAEARLELGAVYTALVTLTSEECDRLRGDPCFLPQGRGRERVSALAQLDRHTRLVLLGDPGSGKSTFVNFVALCLAGARAHPGAGWLERLTEPLPTTEDEEPARQPWRHGTLLPLRVELREFAARGLSAPGADATAKHLCDFVAAELAAAALGDYAPYLWETLREEGGLLLLDGLDEVPAARKRRAQIKGVVEDFAKAFPACRILVTSRTYAYQRQAWRLDGFAETVLAPFGEGQIARFVERWYAHIGALRGLHAEESAGRAELLRRAISNSERLRGLAERPLLLTLMASLHAWRSGSLPEKREELYADTVDLLLDWWERPKVVRDEEQVIVQQPSLAEWLKVDRDKVRGLLNTLAYAAHAEQAELVGTADVPEGALLSGLLRLSQNPDVKPKRLVEYLSQRAGLLLPRGVGVYTFPHRTFQEYLAACHLVVDTYPDKVARLGREEPGRWREVVLLAGAATTARGSDFALWALVEELCPPDALPETQTEADAWGALLAGQALVESADVGQVSARNEPKVKRVQGHLVRILERAALPAVERVAAGDVLAKLGDPRPGVGLREDGLPDLVWCEVPAGVFTMGSENDSLSFLGKETPQRQVEVPRFWISQYPITNAQYEVFVQAGGYRNPAYWTEGAKSQVWTDGKVKAWNDDVARDKPYDYGAPFNLLNHPVVGVTWYEAVAFCRWLTEQVTGGEAWRLGGDGVEAMTIALPSETQWEKAARGTDGRIYPWGDAADPERANYDDTGIGTTSAVGCFPRGASPYGVLDMSGNAWEWCATKFQGSYEDYQDDNDVEGTDARVLRGGAFHYTDRSVRCAYRYYGSPYNRYGGNGFRVVASPSAPVFSERPAPAVSERPALHSG